MQENKTSVKGSIFEELGGVIGCNDPGLPERLFARRAVHYVSVPFPARDMVYRSIAKSDWILAEKPKNCGRGKI